MPTSRESSPLVGGGSQSPRDDGGEGNSLQNTWDWFMGLVPDKEIVLFCLYSGYVTSVIARSTIDVTSSSMVQDKSLGLDSGSMANIFAVGMVAALSGKLLNGLVVCSQLPCVLPAFRGRRLCSAPFPGSMLRSLPEGA